MNARIIDGNVVARILRAQYRARNQRLAERGVVAGLAVLIAGADPASKIYVQNKPRACADADIKSFHAETVSSAEDISAIHELNCRPDVYGILVQLPLPKHIPIGPVLRAISVDKDVDGFHLYNVGGLVVGDTIFPPCGVVMLLEHEGISVEGKNVVVAGASNIVGKPMALMLMLMQRNSTVCICHAKTRDLAQFTILADILVVAAGNPNLIVPQMVETGAVVIDVGINRLPGGKLVGDFDFEGVEEKASYITPVPGGVGSMTVTMLLNNALLSAERTISS